MTKRIAHDDEIKGGVAKGQCLAKSLNELQGSALAIFFEHAAASVQANQIHLSDP